MWQLGYIQNKYYFPFLILIPEVHINPGSFWVLPPLDLCEWGPLRGPCTWECLPQSFLLWRGLTVLSSLGPKSPFDLFGALWLSISSSLLQPILHPFTQGVDQMPWGALRLLSRWSSLGTVASTRFQEGDLMSRSLPLANVIFLEGSYKIELSEWCWHTDLGWLKFLFRKEPCKKTFSHWPCTLKSDPASKNLENLLSKWSNVWALKMETIENIVFKLKFWYHQYFFPLSIRFLSLSHCHQIQPVLILWAFQM